MCVRVCACYFANFLLFIWYFSFCFLVSDVLFCPYSFLLSPLLTSMNYPNFRVLYRGSRLCKWLRP
ncbi:hypothetical protein BDV33DRAFT_183270 [Aspergillus novoparasiticus]|uniref:Uncharacterized protein n=1 Tax=Aspergillus novoparasiticus TaxID=986946 RepID=A0A5N6E9T1_9EURO|nr:hypothetical protein BDV33DRAFT_183270 [Aspergillus novoparasiticus]